MPDFPFPPDWVTEAVALYLTSLTREQFRSYVAAGIFPAPVDHGHKRLYDRAAINAALASMAPGAPRAGLAPDNGGLRLEALHGKTTKGRRDAA